MFYKYFFYILLILAAVLTIGLCISKPPMHDSLMVYSSDYEIVEVQKVETSKKTVDVTPTNTTPKVKTTKILTNQVATTNKTQSQPVQTKKTVLTKPKTVATVAPKQTKIQSQKNTVKAVTKPQEQKTVTQKQTAPVQKTQQQITQKPVPTQQAVSLTPAQEEIEWNKWRSNLQNSIMRDAKLPILPQGTIFKFSFDVDKYGRVSNVQTWSLTPTYTPYAIQHIAPVIRGYQGHSILDFPTGSKRVTTTVTGQWKISTSQKYSTSANFHDIETVNKGY